MLLSAVAGPANAAAAGAPLDALLTDVCHKKVVFLGEDNHHGSGHTLELKVEIVKRLVDECNFSAIFFEGQIYDFLDLERSFAAHSATRAQVADAIGGLWSTTAEIDPLVSYAFDQAASGRLRLAGLDPQTSGATQLYSQRMLPVQLSRYLAHVRRGACETELHRLTNWQYDDDQHPYDDAARGRLRRCAQDIQAALARRGKDESSAVAAVMASNILHFLDFADTDWAPRERAMYENFQWHRARLRKDAKVIVWASTVHGQNMSTTDGRARLGFYVHRELGQQAATIGFSALSGSYGRPGKAQQLVAAPADSLEARALAGCNDDVCYVDHKQLDASGTIAARALAYDTLQTLAWAKILDGVVILREERPPTYVRSAKPQQLQAQQSAPAS